MRRNTFPRATPNFVRFGASSGEPVWEVVSAIGNRPLAPTCVLVHVRELNGETIDGLALVTVVLTIMKLVYGTSSELGVRNDSLGSSKSAELRNSR